MKELRNLLAVLLLCLITGNIAVALLTHFKI